MYRRVFGSFFMRPYRVCSGLHGMPRLLVWAGCIRWGEVGHEPYTNRPISALPIQLTHRFPTADLVDDFGFQQPDDALSESIIN